MENNKTENLYTEESYDNGNSHVIVQPDVTIEIKNDNTNKTGRILTTLGLFIIISGVIVGIIFGYKDYEFRWGFVLICLTTGVFSGLLFMGLGEIIILLQKLVDKD